MTRPTNLTAEIKTQAGEILLTLPVPQKEFKTGSRGFYANKKLEIDGIRYQIQIQLVEIGSKKIAQVENE